MPFPSLVFGHHAVLITGCSSTQIPYDCQPEEGDPHGAFTYAIKRAFDEDPDLSYRDLIVSVRRKLTHDGFCQRPQLACTPGNADRLFIC
jgi:Caspase domain